LFLLNGREVLLNKKNEYRGTQLREG